MNSLEGYCIIRYAIDVQVKKVFLNKFLIKRVKTNSDRYIFLLKDYRKIYTGKCFKSKQGLTPCRTLSLVLLKGENNAQNNHAGVLYKVIINHNGLKFVEGLEPPNNSFADYRVTTSPHELLLG